MFQFVGGKLKSIFIPGEDSFESCSRTPLTTELELSSSSGCGISIQ